MRSSLIIIGLLTFFFSQSQDYQLTGHIQDWNDKYLFLSEYYGDKIQVIDSTRTSETGDFEFVIKNSTPKGLYRLSIADEHHLDIILNKENINLNTHIADPFNNLRFNTSLENQIYLDYIQKRNYNQYCIELLQPVISYYPMTDNFFPTLIMEFTNIQNELNQYIDSVISLYSNNFAATLISIDRRPIVDPMQNQEQQKAFAKKYFFDGKDFSDTAIIHTNILTSTLLTYLSLYHNNTYNKDQTEEEFIKAIDVMLPFMNQNKKVYEFVIDYLISGFDQFGMNKLITHIASKSIIDESCENENLKHRLETLKTLVTGNKVPEIIFEDKKLYHLNKKYVLVVFYASWCEHCNELMPQLETFYENHQKELEIFSISVDTSRTDYQNYINQHLFKWINVCDFKGWESKPAIDYGIYVTPNMFLLDKKKIIIGRPDTIEDLEKLIQ